MLAVGLSWDAKGKLEADRRIRRGLGMIEADCPEVWRRVRQLPMFDVVGLLRGQMLA